MANVQPKFTSRFDDDADFAASFVLNRTDVDDALAASSSSDAPPPPETAHRSKKIVYAAAAVALLVAVGLVWLMQ